MAPSTSVSDISNWAAARAPSISRLRRTAPTTYAGPRSCRRSRFAGIRSSGPGRAYAPSERTDFLFRQSPPLADREVRDADRADRGADQFQHAAAGGFDHAPHLPVTAFGENDFDKRVLRAVAQPVHLGRAGWAVVQFDAAAQALDLLLAEQCRGFRLVGFGHQVRGAGDVVGEGCVVGHQQQAARVQIEAAYSTEE